MARIPKSSPWALEFVGKKFNPEKALQEEWYDQSSDNFHYGVPRGKGLWLKRLDPAEHCGCHMVMIFIMVVLAPDGNIRWAGEQIQQVFNDGHGEVIDVPLFPSDSGVAQEELRKVTSEPESPQPVVKRPSRKKKA